MDTADLLERIAATLRRDVAPAVGASWPRTQTHMAAVVLGKLAAEARAAAHRAADAADTDTLYRELLSLAAAEPLPPDVHAALEAAARERSDLHLGRLIERLYGARSLLGTRCDRLLGLIRQCLRARLERELERAA